MKEGGFLMTYDFKKKPHKDEGGMREEASLILVTYN